MFFLNRSSVLLFFRFHSSTLCARGCSAADVPPRSDASAASAAWRILLYLLSLLGRILFFFCCSSAAVPGSSPAASPGGVPFPEPEILQSQFRRDLGPKQRSEMIHVCHLQHSEPVIHHGPVMTSCIPDYSSGPLLSAKECFCPGNIKYSL